MSLRPASPAAAACRHWIRFRRAPFQRPEPAREAVARHDRRQPHAALAARVRALRCQGLTYAVIAQRLGISKRYVARLLIPVQNAERHHE